MNTATPDRGRITARVPAQVPETLSAAAGIIGSSILLAMMSACVVGLSIPAALHALKLDPKIAAGPITLALADIGTLLIYFSLATLVLR